MFLVQLWKSVAKTKRNGKKCLYGIYIVYIYSIYVHKCLHAIYKEI